MTQADRIHVLRASSGLRSVRIWHLMALVLAVALVFALMAQVPALGVLVLLDVAAVACAITLIRFDQRIQHFWSWVTRRGGEHRPFREWLMLTCSAIAVTIYQAATAFVWVSAVLLSIATGIVAVATMVSLL